VTQAAQLLVHKWRELHWGLGVAGLNGIQQNKDG